MDEIAYKIKNYVLEFFGNSASAEDQDRRARIMLFSDDLKGIAGDLGFYPTQKLWLKQDHVSDPASDTPTLVGHMSTNELGSVLNTLRYEKPIYVAWVEKLQQVSLRTYLEPVGEQEA
ncbi:MAG: hypothetical protein GTO14_15465 [Anaerolineales bacterium]|nr:hypothetical protein [Anaerolineales bacterium]